MSKIKKEQFVPGKVRKVKKGNATITVISINANELPINEQGWTNVGIQNRKNGTQFMFNYNDYIKQSQKPEEKLLNILNSSEDLELENRKIESK